jgi:serine/threonine-protein kinase
MKSPASLDELAGAILDGTPVDWGRLDAASGGPPPDVIERLKILAAVRFTSRIAESERADGRSWGHLQVLESIGRGAFGEVFRAWDTRLDREVALKLLPDSLASGGSRPSVIEEGRLLARIHHPNVVTIHGAERLEGHIGLWMEYVKGHTLEEVLREGRRFDAAEATRIGIELCRAVSAVHAAGLIHRDIKAQNVMIAAGDGRLVLMDFGTGRELDEASDGTIAGTPLYLAPEVLLGAPPTACSDIYSIGVLLHRILAKSYPVEAADLAELRRRHGSGERVDLRAAPDVPQRLARVIGRACEPDPSRRYATADALHEALVGLQGMPAAVRRAYAAAVVGVLISVGLVLWGDAARDASAPRVPGRGAAVEIHGPRLAVLPFRNLSTGADSDTFVDGLTAELIRRLAAITGLQIRSEGSSFAFKGKPRELQLIAAELGVDLVVEANVLRAGSRLRVDARLVRVADEATVWTQEYDRPAGDLFAIQDEIARGIATTLGLSPSPKRRQTTQLDTYELYLRAQSLIVKGGIDNAIRAIPLLEQVIARDPGFAPAYARAAGAYALMSWQLQAGDGSPALSNAEAVERMRPLAKKAVELDPLLAEGHAAMGDTYAREQGWNQARESYERAIALDPSLTDNATNYAYSVLLPLGEVPLALRHLEAALIMDPQSLDVRRSLAFSQIVAGRYDEAIGHLRRVLRTDPDYPHTSLPLARALTFSGKLVEAEALWSTRNRVVWAAHLDVRMGKREEIERLVAATDHPYRRAILFAALGDKERTLEALDRAVDVLPHRTALLLVLPEMALLRGDPRLIPIRRKLRLPMD